MTAMSSVKVTIEVRSLPEVADTEDEAGRPAMWQAAVVEGASELMYLAYEAETRDEAVQGVMGKLRGAAFRGIADVQDA